MRTLFAILLLSACACAQGIGGNAGMGGKAGIGGGASAASCTPSSNFAGSNLASLTTITSWTVTQGTFTLNGSNAVYPNASGVNSIAFWNVCAPPNDQTSTVTIVATSGVAYIGPAARIQAGANQGYRCITNGTNTVLQLENGAGETNLGSAGAAVAAGHTLSIVATGTALKCQDNGVDITGPSGTDATFASGSCGIAAFHADVGTTASTFTCH